MLRGFGSLAKAAERLVRLPPASTARLQTFLSHTTKSAFGLAHNISGSSRSFTLSHDLSSLARSHQTPIHVRSNLSLPARIALGRPLSTPFLPRVPALPRPISQVGLGTARNFSSSRPVFQNIVDNVPIATRAFWEADWEIKQGKQVKHIKQRPRTKKTFKKVAEKLKAKENMMTSQALSTATSEASALEYSQYFAAPQKAQEVTSFLTIPLSPPSLERSPLPSVTSVDLLPRSHLYDVHNAHDLHAIRVASLFRRLDAADVWARGVECECYGLDGDDIGIPKSLKLIFRGWTDGEVKAIVGEAIKGWCTVETVVDAPEELLEDQHLPSTQDLFVHSFSLAPVTPPDTPRMSFILPSLDFSSSFVSQHSDVQLSNVWDSSSLSGTSTPSIYEESQVGSDEDVMTEEHWHDEDWSHSSSSDEELESATYNRASHWGNQSTTSSLGNPWFAHFPESPSYVFA